MNKRRIGDLTPDELRARAFDIIDNHVLIHIDDDAPVDRRSEDDGSAWVQAWVNVNAQDYDDLVSD
jgi:hypothetical protein